MSGPVPNDGVRRSVLGWLRRLEWNHLTEEALAPLRDAHGGAVLEKRLLPWLRRYRFDWRGQQVRLAPDSLPAIIEQVAACCHLRDWPSASNALHHLLLEGVPSEQVLPDGSRVLMQVPLIDWTNVRRNHWDVAESTYGLPPSGAPEIRELVGYVNGLPLVVVACVERDRQGRWGTAVAGIEHLWRGMVASSIDPPPLQAQLLLSVERRGGRYATVGTPRHAWVRWREHGWSLAVQAQRRDAAIPFMDSPLESPRAAHAELLHGLLAPARLLEVLRLFVRVTPDGGRCIARSAQFFAVQHALQALRTVDADGRRSGGQLCLAAGSGLRQTRHWLLKALADDPSLAALRVLVPVTHSTAPVREPRRRPCGPLPPCPVAELLARRAPASLEVPLRVLSGWARGVVDPLHSHDLVLLADADFWESGPALLRGLRNTLPGAAWLTLAAHPIPALAPDLDPGPGLFSYPPQQAVEDGVVVPVWTDGPLLADAARRVSPPRDTDTATALRTLRMAPAIAQHFHRFARLAKRDLRALLLVGSAQRAQDYHQAFAVDGNLHVQAIGYDDHGVPRDRSCRAVPPEVELIIAYGALPTARDPRLALLYIDRALADVERLRAVGLTTSPHPEKHAGLLVDLHDTPVEHAVQNPEGRISDWLPAPLTADPQLLSSQRRRLHVLMPVGADEDFHACRDHLAPHWALTRQGGDVDLHRRRRDLLHSRVTAFGRRLQIVAATETTGGGVPSAQQGAQYRQELHRYSLLRDAASHEALELGRYGAEDVRVRHWAREQAPEVRELEADYLMLRATERPDASATQRANLLYTQLRLRLDHPAEEPRFADQARHALLQVLAEGVDPNARLQALTALQAAQRPPLGAGDAAPCSRGLLLLGGFVDVAANPDLYRRIGARIDALVADARRLPPQVFRDTLRAALPPLLQGCLQPDRIHAVVDAALARAPHWPAAD
ncbi:type I restriction endonuclease [Stenotrophomonas sp. PD6]|uniref:type I restriction endonuclease n=1 Tax=Stenotrophomonas sp. PD6 TaxID=3368612 RepID=UPI003BA01C28